MANKLDRKFPDVQSMAEAARRRIPGFAYDYLSAGVGSETGLARNRSALDDLQMRPRYIVDSITPDLSADILGQSFSAPFGVAPIGLTGMMWPRSAEYLAAAARAENIPFAISTYATTSLEKIAKIAGANAWFQLYYPLDDEIAGSILSRAQSAGYDVLLVTVDIPAYTRRVKEIHNGLSLPPKMNARNLAQMLVRPRWCLESLKAGVPQFETFLPYIPDGYDMQQLAEFAAANTVGHVTPERLKVLRDQWPGKLVVKGVLDPADAEACRDIGVDGLVVSNHGARQIDAAPSPMEVIGAIRSAVGQDLQLLADSGVRSGLDIARMLAAGADFVLAGRAFMFAVSAIGEAGAGHAIHVLRDDLRSVMGQLGCATIADLSKMLVTD